MTPLRTLAAISTALVVGLASGMAVASEPVTRTPSVCHAAFDRVEDLFERHGELLHQVRLRGDALGKDAYRKHDAAVVRILGELEPVEASYASARAECLGGAS